MEKIKIYTNANCPYCKTIKERLNSENIEFNEFLTSEYPDIWREVSGLTSMPTVPTIEFKKELLIPSRDYSNPNHLIKILQEIKESKEPYNRRVFEKLKTLNFNINMAFVKLDKTLRDIENKIK